MTAFTMPTPESLPSLLHDLAEVHGLEAVKQAIETFVSAAPKNGKYVLNQQGLSDEAKVIEYLGSVAPVVRADRRDDRLHDIDCYWQGEKISIKAQHSGLKYGNIYFELATFHRCYREWTPETLSAFLGAVKSDTTFSCDTQSASPSWFYTGQATVYAILQGDRLRLYRKSDIEAYIRKNGWLRVRGLSWKVLQTQSGVNSFSGYLDSDNVPYFAEFLLT